MKAPRTFAYFTLIYSGILAVSLIVLAIMSLTAYGCAFDFRLSSVTYMLYLMYYRAAQCYTELDWSILDRINFNSNVTIQQPIMPTETDAVFRTIFFSIFYLVLSLFLVITCFLALGGLRRTGKSKHLVFWLYFAPFIVIFVTMIVMDLVSSGFYLVDYFKTLSVNGLMRILEIGNPEEMRQFFDRLSITTRTTPPLIMFAVTSKCILLLGINIAIVFMFPPAVWRVCKENEEIIIKTTQRLDLQRKPASTEAAPPSRHPNVKVTVTNVEPNEPDEEPSDRNGYEAQPPYNPYLTNPKKQDTRC